MNAPAFNTARPRGPFDQPLKQRDCDADGATQKVEKPVLVAIPPRHPATNIGE